MQSDAETSVIVPVYNGARYLQAAVESIAAQKHPIREIIVVDDGSTDDTCQVARSLSDQLTYIRQENQGPAAARNRGLQAASGKVIAFLDVDDCWRPEKLEIQLPLLLSDDSLDAVWGMTQVLMLSESESEDDCFTPLGVPRFFPQLGSLLFRRVLMEQLGGFDVRHSHADDIDLIARAKESAATIYQHQDVVLDWRRHQTNITNDVAQARKDFVSVIKRALDRKR